MSLTASLRVSVGTFSLEAALDVPAGSVLAVLGPNGAGKTTLLRALAGLVPASGPVVVSGVDLAGLAPEARGVGVVFQDYRLFPHLSVLGNVAFGVPGRAARRSVLPLLAALDLEPLADRRPAQLSGGQAQRVALARALATRPRMLLLDEPMAALDARTRQEVRTLLRSRLDAFEGPVVLVTHDPLEAMVLADRMLVLEQGRVVQTGPPASVARRPATEYVARLMGLNLYSGTAAHGSVAVPGGAFTVADEALTGPVLVSLAPSAVMIHVKPPDGASARNRWPGTVRGLELLRDRVRVDIEGPPDTIADVTPAAVAELGLAPGARVWLTVKATELTVYPAPG
jgi:molybdate transport system ATP-binding protein